MSQEPDQKRRKMEPHISGDDNSTETPHVSGVLASKTLARSASGSASGDFGDTCHQYTALVTRDSTTPYAENSDKQYDLCRQTCEYGDTWAQKYTIPLSKCPQRPIRTGNIFYDGIIPDLELIGYKPLHVIARGKSGTIVLAQNVHHSQHFQEQETVPVAIKLNSGKAKRGSTRMHARQEMLEEMSIHKSLHHPNIVTWLSGIEHKGRLGTVMEYCENGNLEELLQLHKAQFITEGVARRYFRQIHAAIDYLHSHGFGHRDICPQNVLLSNGNQVKLCDFGHCVRWSKGLCTDDAGSLGYQAPEVLSHGPYNPKLADIWSLGATLFSMCIGKPPLGTIKSDILLNASREIRFPAPHIMVLTPEFKALVKGLLTSKPNARFTLNRINHDPWMSIKDTHVQISNFFQVRHPRKTNEGSLEYDLKTKLNI